MTTRIFLVDDHEIVRRGIADLLDREPDLEVVGEAGDASHALGRIAATMPDVAILDVRLPDGDGIELCREVRSRHPEVRCLILDRSTTTTRRRCPPSSRAQRGTC